MHILHNTATCVLFAQVDYFSCLIFCDNSLYTLSYVQNLHIPRNSTTFVLIIHEIKQPMTTETPQLNDHNKAEYPPMHNGEFDTSQIFQL